MKTSRVFKTSAGAGKHRVDPTVTLVVHKDDEVARMASEALVKGLNRVAVVSAGMRIDSASEEDIRKLLRNAKATKSKPTD